MKLSIFKYGFVFLILNALLFSQTKDSIAAEISDSTKFVERKTTLSINPFVKQDFNFFINQNLSHKYFFEDQNLYGLNTTAENDSMVLSKSELIRIRESMNQSFSVFRQGELKRDLGVFGKFLGYGQAAATLGLAIYHIYKYGLK